MVEFRLTADNNALDVWLYGKHIGAIQRHPGRNPRFVTRGSMVSIPLEASIPLDELEQICKKLKDYAQTPVS